MIRVILLPLVLCITLFGCAKGLPPTPEEIQVQVEQNEQENALKKKFPVGQIVMHISGIKASVSREVYRATDGECCVYIHYLWPEYGFRDEWVYCTELKPVLPE